MNLINRDFHADKPNRKWLTAITEIKACDGKVYVYPMIDCCDGRIVAYTTGLHPNARLANAILRKAIGTLPDDIRPIVHADRGCHYRWPGWLRLCAEHGILRSMSAKGCSPDNSAVEGFFGRMKTSGGLSPARGAVHLPAGHGTRRHDHALVQPPTHQTIPGLKQSHTIQNETRATPSTTHKKYPQ